MCLFSNGDWMCLCVWGGGGDKYPELTHASVQTEPLMSFSGLGERFVGSRILLHALPVEQANQNAYIIAATAKNQAI